MSDFEEVLGNWEKRRKESREEPMKNPMYHALDRYPPSGQVKREKETPGSTGTNRRLKSGKKLPISEVVDLHGCTRKEALRICGEVVRKNATHLERRRILIIHGKGIHSDGQVTLREVVRKFLQDHPLVGETGVPPAGEGGDGAVWAVCRHRSR